MVDITLAPSFWKLDRQYDDQQKSGLRRHLSIYEHEGFFEAVWEKDEHDFRRVTSGRKVLLRNALETLEEDIKGRIGQWR